MFITHYLLHFGPLFYHLVSSSLHWPFPSKIQHSSFSIANLPSRQPCNKTYLQATFQGLSISHHLRLVHMPPSKTCSQATIQGLFTGYHPRPVHRPPSKACPWATIPRLVHGPPFQDLSMGHHQRIVHRPPFQGLSTGHHPGLVPKPPFQGLSKGHYSKACLQDTIQGNCPQATILKRVVHRPPTKKGLPTAYLFWLAIPWIKCDKLVVIDTCIPCHVISITFTNYCAKK